jgi:cell division protein FtsQ
VKGARNEGAERGKRPAAPARAKTPVDLARVNRGPNGERLAPLPRKALRAERPGWRQRWSEGRAPNLAALAATLAFLGLTGVYGAILGGHVASARAAAGDAAVWTARSAGFAVSEFRVTGNEKMSPSEILARIGVDHRTSLLGFDTALARVRLLEVPWVKNASVRVFLPGTLEVTMEERHPFALWQRGGRVMLIDREGQVIGPYDDLRFSHLPLVVGEGAEKRVAEFGRLIDPHPVIRSRLRAAVLVAERRWTLKFADGVDVMLPERDASAALTLLERLDRESGLLNRDIALVDLRIADRVVVRLTDRAAALRADQTRQRTRAPGAAPAPAVAPTPTATPPQRPGRVG